MLGSKFYSVLSILFFLSAPPALAADKITVTIGQGRLTLQMDGLPLDEQSKKELETTLLMNKKLQSIVDSGETRTIVLEGEAVDKIHKTLRSARDQAGRQIQTLIQSQFSRAAAPPTAADPQEQSDEQDQPAVIRTGETQVIAGSKYHVQPGEFLQQLISFGSDVTVDGEVGELVAIGGKVTLRSGSMISKELVTVGAELQQEQGAEIAKLTSGLQWHGIDHSFFGFREYRQEFWPQTWVQIIRIFILCFLGWMWFQMAPVFHQDVQLQLRKKPIASIFWTIFALFLLIPTTILLIVSIVGIALLPVLFLMYVVFWFMAEVHWAKLISDKLPYLKTQNLFIQLLAGLIIFEVIDRLIPPDFDWIPYTFMVIGFGAIFSQFLRRGIAWRN